MPWPQWRGGAGVEVHEAKRRRRNDRWWFSLRAAAGWYRSLSDVCRSKETINSSFISKFANVMNCMMLQKQAHNTTGCSYNGCYTIHCYKISTTFCHTTPRRQSLKWTIFLLVLCTYVCQVLFCTNPAPVMPLLHEPLVAPSRQIKYFWILPLELKASTISSFKTFFNGPKKIKKIHFNWKLLLNSISGSMKFLGALPWDYLNHLFLKYQDDNQLLFTNWGI